MQRTFEKLQQLQEILSEKYAIENRLSELPKQLITKKEVLQRITKTHDEKATAKADAEKQLGQLRVQLAVIQDTKQNLEQKMSLIKTQREFELLEKEINDANQTEEVLRKENQQVQAEITELDRELDLTNQLIAAQEEELASDTKIISEQNENEQKRLAELSKREAAIIPEMDADLLFKFESIIRNKSGLGIVAVTGGICSGCHMVLPAQFVNDVRSNKEIYFCPNCSRIIYFEEGEDKFSNVFFDDDEIGGLSDLIDDDDFAEDEEEPPLIDEDMAGDYEDN